MAESRQPDLAGGEGLGAPRSPRAGGPLGGRRWIAVAAGVVVLGVALSVGGFYLQRARVRADQRAALRTTAADVTATLAATLQRDLDFVASVRAVDTLQPRLTNASFGSWYAALQGARGRVGGVGTALIAVVPAARLSAFVAASQRDPTWRLIIGGRYRIIPAGRRTRYCLIKAFAGGVPTAASAGLLQLDYCAASIAGPGLLPSGPSSLSASLLAEADADAYGAADVPPLPIAGDRGSTLFVGAPVYRLGTPLSTVAQRRAALVGWAAGSFDQSTLISSAVGAHRNLAVALYRRDLGGRLALVGQSSTPAPAGAVTRTTAVQAEGTWLVRVQGVPRAAGSSATVQGLLVLAAGLIVTLLVVLLTVVLGRSREAALRLVAEKTAELRFRAMHDSLTGLPNRELVLDRTEQMLARARRFEVPVAAMYVDLDAFKQINDTYGHAAGDELLCSVGERLRAVVRESDTVGRLAGDEFVVLLESTLLDGAPDLVGQRILDVLRQPQMLMAAQPDTPVAITASLGIAAGARSDAEQLLRDADVALYEAKASGRDRCVIFEPAMKVAAEDRLGLELDLGRALDAHEFFLLYQPILDLDSEVTTGVEALIRWRHPTRGIVSPETFVPVAEQSGLIIRIGRWALEQACRQAASWQRDGRRLEMAVNVSGRQLDEDVLVDDVRDALEQSGIDPARLTLEITETALMRDAEASALRLRRLKELGVRVAIDDFGTGYSSLAYLQQFPIDALKIDGSFISGTPPTPAGAALIHTLVQLGKTLGLETLGEGIERDDQLRRLQQEQCDRGQGFLFARPLTPRGVERFLQKTSRVAAPSPHLLDH